jgi:hypothetical protein
MDSGRGIRRRRLVAPSGDVAALMECAKSGNADAIREVSLATTSYNNINNHATVTVTPSPVVSVLRLARQSCPAREPLEQRCAKLCEAKSQRAQTTQAALTVYS